jgi:hypothetical protein
MGFFISYPAPEVFTFPLLDRQVGFKVVEVVERQCFVFVGNLGCLLFSSVNDLLDIIIDEEAGDGV